MLTIVVTRLMPQWLGQGPHTILDTHPLGRVVSLPPFGLNRMNGLPVGVPRRELSAHFTQYPFTSLGRCVKGLDRAILIFFV